MARTFTGTNRVTQGTAAIPTTGMLSVWWLPTFTIADSAWHTVLRVTGGGTTFFDLIKYSDNNLYVGWYNSGEKRVVVNATTAGLTKDVWNHLCLTWTNGGTSELWVNGTSRGTTASLSAWDTTGNTRYVGNFSTAEPATGSLAEFAIWSAAGTNADVAALAAGYAPPHVLPASLVDYLPLMGQDSPEPNYAPGGTCGTLETGTPAKADHCRVIRRRGRRVVAVPTAAGGGRLFRGGTDLGGLGGAGQQSFNPSLGV